MAMKGYDKRKVYGKIPKWAEKKWLNHYSWVKKTQKSSPKTQN